MAKTVDFCPFVIFVRLTGPSLSSASAQLEWNYFEASERKRDRRLFPGRVTDLRVNNVIIIVIVITACAQYNHNHGGFMVIIMIMNGENCLSKKTGMLDNDDVNEMVRFISSFWPIGSPAFLDLSYCLGFSRHGYGLQSSALYAAVGASWQQQMKVFQILSNKTTFTPSFTSHFTIV